MQLSKKLFLVVFITLACTAGLFFPAALTAPRSAHSDMFTVNYVLPNMDTELHYTATIDDREDYQFTVTWTETSPGAYKQICLNQDGSQDFALYQITDDYLLCTEKGFIIPESESSIERTVSGSNVVFRQVSPGGSWQCCYITTDSYDNRTEYQCTYQYIGREDISIHGEDRLAFKLVWQKSRVVTPPAGPANWLPASGNESGTDWYVPGLGLAKRTGRSATTGSPEQTHSYTILLTSFYDTSTAKGDETV